MKYCQLFLMLFLSVPLISQAQNFSKEYGKVGKNEIELSTYAKDTEAEAVVLFDFGKSYFVDSETGFDVVFERKKRIKILSEACAPSFSKAVVNIKGSGFLVANSPEVTITSKYWVKPKDLILFL